MIRSRRRNLSPSAGIELDLAQCHWGRQVAQEYAESGGGEAIQFAWAAAGPDPQHPGFRWGSATIRYAADTITSLTKRAIRRPGERVADRRAKWEAGAMNQPQPAVVAVYDVGSSEHRRVAEFRVGATGTAVLHIADPAGCLMAQRWFERGVRAGPDTALIGPERGSEFLRALLDLPGMSYYRVVDESAPTAGP